MTYNQDFINQAHQICFQFLREKDFNKMDMMDRLRLAGIPEDLAIEVLASYEVDEDSEKKNRAKKYLKRGFVLLLLAMALVICIYVWTGNIYVFTSIIVLVPGLLYLVTGVRELLDANN